MRCVRTDLLPELAGEARVGVRVLEQTHGELDTKDPVDGVVDSAHGDDLVLNLCRQIVDEFCVSEWNHDLHMIVSGHGQPGNMILHSYPVTKTMRSKQAITHSLDNLFLNEIQKKKKTVLSLPKSKTCYFSEVFPILLVKRLVGLVVIRLMLYYFLKTKQLMHMFHASYSHHVNSSTNTSLN
jgi:hypothetical protein